MLYSFWILSIKIKIIQNNLRILAYVKTAISYNLNRVLKTIHILELLFSSMSFETVEKDRFATKRLESKSEMWTEQP